MKSLSAGGLVPAYNLSRNELNERHGDKYYQPNGGGFYELSREEYRHEDFPSRYEGMLVKLLFEGLHRLLDHECRIVFMKRNPEEIRQSYDAFFSGTSVPVRRIVRNYDSIINSVIDTLEKKDTVLSLHTFQYRDVVDAPFNHFQQLMTDGWPIAVDKASAIPNPKLCRFKLEDLTLGI